MTRDEYIVLLNENGACKPALHFARKFAPEATAEEITESYLISRRDEAWALWAVQEIYLDLSPEVRGLFVKKIINPKNAFWLLHNVGLNPEDRAYFEGLTRLCKTEGWFR